MSANNPLLQSYDLPPFSAIRAEHAKVAESAAELAETGRTEPSLSLDLDEPDDTPPLQLSLDDDLEPPLAGERLSATDDEDDERPELAPVSKDRRKRSEPAMREDPLLDLVDDPLQLDWQKRRTPCGTR